MFKFNIKIMFRVLKDRISIFSRILQKHSSMRLALFLLIFLYVGFVNAYNLFYVPPEGRPIKITDTEIYTPPQRFFEKVDVIEVMPKISSEPSKGEMTPKEDTSEEYASVETIPRMQESQKLAIPQQSPTFPPTSPFIEQTKTPQPTLQKPSFTPSSASPSSTKSAQQKIPPISLSNVQQLADKIQLSTLKDGSLVELHMSESYNEVFTIYVQNGIPNVITGESTNEDLEIWFTRSAFEELLNSNYISSTTKRLEGEGRIAAKQKVSDWTLYRKGYKTLADKLDLR